MAIISATTGPKIQLLFFAGTMGFIHNVKTVKNPLKPLSDFSKAYKGAI